MRKFSIGFISSRFDIQFVQSCMILKFMLISFLPSPKITTSTSTSQIHLQQPPSGPPFISVTH
uniref:Uncharacterized protein n=1 Tax=Kalanchoe fedtschenkoi TaxID=63787 RepID=A0A7N0TSI2_KALFE